MSEFKTGDKVLIEAVVESEDVDLLASIMVRTPKGTHYWAHPADVRPFVEYEESGWVECDHGDGDFSFHGWFGGCTRRHRRLFAEAVVPPPHVHDLTNEKHEDGTWWEVCRAAGCPVEPQPVSEVWR